MIKRIFFAASCAAFLALSSTSTIIAEEANDAAMAAALETLDASLPGKLINNPYNIKWNTVGSDKKEAIVKSEGVPGGMAYSVTVKKTKRNSWDTAIRIPTSTDIKKDDVVMVSFWLRAAKLQKGRETGDVFAALQRSSEPYDSVFEKSIEPTSDWKLYTVAGKASRDYSSGKTSMNFNLAKAKQTLEFGQFYMMNLGPNGDASKYIND